MRHTRAELEVHSITPEKSITLIKLILISYIKYTISKLVRKANTKHSNKDIILATMISVAENMVSKLSNVPSAISSFSMILDKLISPRGIEIIVNNTPNSLISL